MYCEGRQEQARHIPQKSNISCLLNVDMKGLSMVLPQCNIRYPTLFCPSYYVGEINLFELNWIELKEYSFLDNFENF